MNYYLNKSEVWVVKKREGEIYIQHTILRLIMTKTSPIITIINTKKGIQSFVAELA